MTEEIESQEANSGDKNWKEVREQNEFLKGKVAEYEAKERTQFFQLAGLDTTKGVGKAVDMMFEGELTVDNIKTYATEEFGVEFGQQDGIQSQVEESQAKLENIVSQVAEISAKGTVNQSITAKLFAMEEAKKNNK